MKGNRTLGVNRLPFFRSAEHSQHLNVSMLTQEEQEGYGYETGFRVLPYLMQDEFSRQREGISVNDLQNKLKAWTWVFCPQAPLPVYLWHSIHTAD